MPLLAREEELDSLASLEERITRAVELLTSLKQENEKLAARVKSAEADRDAAIAESKKATDQLHGLETERKQVRTRIEKLLGQMDQLSAQ